ncbi:MAG: BACON domain-containing protein [Prevotellaceae bacterium]|nr:BACON domain-containing protein [Prevotellaceae bacterium]
MEIGSALSFKAPGGTQFLNVKTNTVFTVASTAAWCTPEIVGKGENNLKITVAENTDPVERNAVITISSEGYDSYKIDVVQGFVPPKPPAPEGTDERIIDLIPDLYYAFHNSANLAAPAVGTADMEFSIPASVVATDAPREGRRAVTITKDNHVKVKSPSPNGAKTYTMLFDVRVPTLLSEPKEQWYALLQTNERNSDDGDLFIKFNGTVGVSQYTNPVIEPTKWYRIVVVVDVQNGASVCKYYINGEFAFANGSSSIPSRMGLNETFWLFTDEDGEEDTLDCSAFALWTDTMLTDDEIAAIGAP